MTTVAKTMFTALSLCAGGVAHGQEAPASSWLIQAGVTRLAMVDKAEISAIGTQIPGAGVDSKAQFVPSVSVTRFVSPSIGISLAVGLPPKIKYDGAGTLAVAGRLVEVRYIAPGLTVLWSPFRNHVIAPYAGAGLTYMHVLSAKDGALQSSKVNNDVGQVLQAGVTVFPGQRWGVFADVKKAFVRTSANGFVSQAPIEARLRMDPVVLQTGISFRF